MRTTRPSPAKPTSGVVQRALSQPGPVNRWIPVGGGGGAWWPFEEWLSSAGAWAMVAVSVICASSLVRVRRQIRDERVDLGRGHGRSEVLGHHVRLVALGDHGVGVDDRLLDEGRKRLSRRLRGRRQVVERGADSTGRAGNRLEGVAGRAAVVLEDRRRDRRSAARGRAAVGALSVLAYQVLYAPALITTAWLRISECPSPQSSVQITG